MTATRSRLFYRIAACLLTAAGSSLLPELAAQEPVGAGFSKYVDANGNITLPDDFETTFVHLGTIAVAAKANGAVSELHESYSRREDVQAFQKTGQFADGAILVKSVRATKAADLTTGHASFADNIKVWFVLVKDSQNRFKDNDLWGDGWGWALFKGDDRKKQVATDYRTDCRGCHVPAKSTDWIYTQCYPLLTHQAAKPKSETSQSESNTKPDLIARFPRWKEAVTLTGNAEQGRKYFETKTVETSLTCASCHSFNSKDTMQIDGDGLRRAGFPIYAAVHRTNIKQSGTGLAALGADVCVVHFMQDPGPGMTAQELADMDRFLHSGGDARHETAKNIDYPKLKWTIPEVLQGGDAKRGQTAVEQTCITCHAVGDRAARIVDAGGKLDAASYQSDDLQRLAMRIRNPKYEHNDAMPGYSDLRLSNETLLDILAWLTKK